MLPGTKSMYSVQHQDLASENKTHLPALTLIVIGFYLTINFCLKPSSGQVILDQLLHYREKIRFVCKLTNASVSLELDRLSKSQRLLRRSIGEF